MLSQLSYSPTWPREARREREARAALRSRRGARRRLQLVPSSACARGRCAPAKAMESLAKRILPPMMGYEWTGVTFQQLEAGTQAPFIFALAIVFVYLFLAAQYESWSIPFSVLLTVPLAILGAALMTMARGLDNGIYFQIGMILLIGMASKNAILIVEFAKQQHDEGLSVLDAALKAAHLRFRPILMTAFSFILGVIPLVIATGAGAKSRVALGSTVLGGMALATLLGVFVIPLLYYVIQSLSERFFGSGVELQIEETATEES